MFKLDFNNKIIKLKFIKYLGLYKKRKIASQIVWYLVI